MKRAKGPFSMSQKVKRLMTKKELEITEGISPENLYRHSPHRLKQYIKLVRKLRDKYRDLTQRQKASQKDLMRNSNNFRTLEKGQVFEQVLTVFEKQAKKLTPQVSSKPALKKKQKELDHEQHYDLDGVTRRGSQVIIPALAMPRINEKKTESKFDSRIS